MDEPEDLTHADFVRSRTDPLHRAATAEFKVAREAFRTIEYRENDRNLYWKSVEFRDLLSLMVGRGHDEYRDKHGEAVADVDALRAEDALRSAAASYALDQLDCDPCRLAYSIVALRFDTDHWPTLDHINERMASEHGFSPHRVNLAMVEAVNARQPRPGIFTYPGVELAERMDFPLPPGAARWSDRFYVDAETQVRLGLAHIYRDATYHSICEEIPK